MKTITVWTLLMFLYGKEDLPIIKIENLPSQQECQRVTREYQKQSSILVEGMSLTKAVCIKHEVVVTK